LKLIRFREKFEKPILRGNDKHASDRDKRVGSSIAQVRIICVPNIVHVTWPLAFDGE